MREKKSRPANSTNFSVFLRNFDLKWHHYGNYAFHQISTKNRSQIRADFYLLKKKSANSGLPRTCYSARIWSNLDTYSPFLACFSQVIRFGESPPPEFTDDFAFLWYFLEFCFVFPACGFSPFWEVLSSYGAAPCLDTALRHLLIRALRRLLIRRSVVS